MPTIKVKQFLDGRGVRYMKYHHGPVYTSQEVAAVTHIAGKEVAKSVLVKIDGKINMFVLPASYRVDLDWLKEEFCVDNIELAKEEEFCNLFPDCEVGAVPPFGNLFSLDVYVSKSLAEDEEIAFTAGSHSEVFKMAYQDYNRLVKPKIMKFSKHE